MFTLGSLCLCCFQECPHTVPRSGLWGLHSPQRTPNLLALVVLFVVARVSDEGHVVGNVEVTLVPLSRHEPPTKSKNFFEAVDQDVVAVEVDDGDDVEGVGAEVLGDTTHPPSPKTSSKL